MCYKVQRVIIRGENGALLELEKGHSPEIKQALMRMRNGHLSKEKGHPSDFEMGIYQSWKATYMKMEKGPH